MIIACSGKVFCITVAEALYGNSVLHKCFYWYTGNYGVEINPPVDGQSTIVLTASEAFTSQQEDALADKVKRDLIDFALRDIVSRETATVRELLIAKAFAHYDTAGDPQTAVADPVGFDTKTISVE
ncbi:MAG: His-Xaa-Ser system protein HxsD [Bacteroidota bacterium]